MNQVWFFFKVIEVVLGTICMFFHIKGSLYIAEPLPHVLVYCATFLSYTTMAALGAFRLLLTRSSVLTTQLLVTLSAVFFHYFCGILIMRTALEDPHMNGFNSSFEYLEHPHFAHCKLQSIATLTAGTMYLMHMFHVLDLLARLEPGDWRRQATSPGKGLAEGDRGGLYVLSKPVDNFLCRHCRCFYHLAHSQALHFKTTELEQSQWVGRFWDFLGIIHKKFCSVAGAEESDESFMSTPTITSSSEELPMDSDYDIALEEEAGGKGPKTFSTWRGSSDSTSLWAQIEDRSTLNLQKSRTSQTTEITVRPSLMDRKERRRASIWDDTGNKTKSEILLVNNAELLRASRESVVQNSEADDAPNSPRKSGRESKIHFEAEKAAETKDIQLESAAERSIVEPESPKSDQEGQKDEKSKPGESQEKRKEPE